MTIDSEILQRKSSFFTDDVKKHQDTLNAIVTSSSFLVIGAAGSIGQAVTQEIFKRKPKKLHAVDISENNLVELVRTIRSQFGYIEGDFATYALDCGTKLFDHFWNSDGEYDYVLNLSALKHVRSEKDAYTLSRMIDVNIVNTVKTLELAEKRNVKNYFVVSTDKAANPANLMGATKRIMELFAMQSSQRIPVSMARFANVAFSDGSLLHGFDQRFLKKQPLTAPNDIRRYFISKQEAGELCLLSCLLGGNREIFYPKMSADKYLRKFTEIAEKYLELRGYNILKCDTEQEARDNITKIDTERLWPCYFFESDTNGEKSFEEFFTSDQKLDETRFNSIGVIKNDLDYDASKLATFKLKYDNLLSKDFTSKQNLIDLIKFMVPELNHIDTGKSLDQRM